MISEAEERVIAFFDGGGIEAYEAMLRGDPAKDLEWLEVDSPRVRWLAARDYLRELRDTATREWKQTINRAMLIATFCDYVDQNAMSRNNADFCVWSPWPYQPERSDGVPVLGYAGSIHYVSEDFIEAKQRILEQYSGETRARANKILDEFDPPFDPKKASYESYE